MGIYMTEEDGRDHQIKIGRGEGIIAELDAVQQQMIKLGEVLSGLEEKLTPVLDNREGDSAEKASDQISALTPSQAISTIRSVHEMATMLQYRVQDMTRRALI